MKTMWYRTDYVVRLDGEEGSTPAYFPAKDLAALQTLFSRLESLVIPEATLTTWRRETTTELIPISLDEEELENLS